MRNVLALILILFCSKAYAFTETTLQDSRGNYVGTSSNPLHVSLTGGGGSGNVGIGTTGRIPAYLSTTVIGSPYNNVMDANGNIGVGSATPGQALDVNGTVRGISLVATGSGPSSTTGNLGVGTATPGTALDVNGTIRATGFTAANNFGIHPGVTVVVASSTSRNKASADYVCTGTADDVCIQNALNSIPAAAGGHLVLLEGTFNITATLSWTNNSSLWISGAGQQGTTIFLSNTSAVDMISLAPASVLTAFFKISDLTLNGNKANNASGRGIFGGTNAEDIIVQNVFIDATKGNAIELTTAWGFRLDTSAIEDSGAGGVIIDNGVTDAHILNNKFINNTGNDLTIPTGSAQNQIIGNLFDTGAGTSTYAISLDGYWNVVIGNTFYPNEATTASGIDVLKSYDTIIGNTFNDQGAPSTMTNSIKLESGTSNNTVTDNTFYFSDNNRISDLGTTNSIWANNGVHGAGGINIKNVGTLYTTGNVGITNSNPGQALDVGTGSIISTGSLGIGTTAVGGSLTVGGINQQINVGNTALATDRSYMVFGNGRALFGYDGTTQDTAIGATGGRGIKFSTNQASFGVSPAMWLNSNGNLGLGTTSTPTTLLDVYGTLNSAHDFNVLTSGNTGIGSTAPGQRLDVGGTVRMITLGSTLSIASGSNGCTGSGTLSAGKQTVSTACTPATAAGIFVTDTNQTGGNIGAVGIGTVSANTSFVVESTNSLDASTYNWVIIKSQ